LKLSKLRRASRSLCRCSCGSDSLSEFLDFSNIYGLAASIVKYRYRGDSVQDIWRKVKSPRVMAFGGAAENTHFGVNAKLLLPSGGTHTGSSGFSNSKSARILRLM
jgi:hypothetical protein